MPITLPVDILRLVAFRTDVHTAGKLDCLSKSARLPHSDLAWLWAHTLLATPAPQRTDTLIFRVFERCFRAKHIPSCRLLLDNGIEADPYQFYLSIRPEDEGYEDWIEHVRVYRDMVVALRLGPEWVIQLIEGLATTEEEDKYAHILDWPEVRAFVLEKDEEDELEGSAGNMPLTIEQSIRNGESVR